MTRFILGVLVTLAVSAIGYDRIERALRGADTVVRATYDAAAAATKKEMSK